MEILAVPVTQSNVDMPGKAANVNIYNISEDKSQYTLMREYKNPSLESRDGGLPLLDSLIKDNVNSIILPGIGGPGITFLNNRIRVYLSTGSEMESIKNYLLNKLEFTDKPTIFDCPESLFEKAEEYKNKL